LVGTRDLDPLESKLLEGSGIDVILPDRTRSDLQRALHSIQQHVDTIYVHLDLDVLDSAVASANSYARSGGLTLEDMDEALSMIGTEFQIAAVTLSAYDPAVDTAGRAAKAAIRLISSTARVAGRA
jgi:arginase family enzyme